MQELFFQIFLAIGGVFLGNRLTVAYQRRGELQAASTPVWAYFHGLSNGWHRDDLEPVQWDVFIHSLPFWERASFNRHHTALKAEIKRRPEPPERMDGNFFDEAAVKALAAKCLHYARRR